MKDAFDRDLVIGQEVIIPCNSILKKGILYNYRPNNSKYYIEAVETYNKIEAGEPVSEYRRWRCTKE